jgi:tetratricopeptide (TPR) repeat protein
VHLLVRPATSNTALQTPRLLSVCATLSMSAAVLVMCALLVFGASHRLIDATSTAILPPSIFLFGLLIAAANKKGLHPWQNTSDNVIDPSPRDTSIANDQVSAAQTHPISSTSNRANPYAALLGQCIIYVLMPGLANELINVWNVTTSWGQHLPEALALEVPMSILCTALIAYVLEVVLYRVAKARNLKNTALSAGPLFNTFIIAWLLMFLLPTMQFAMNYRSLGAAIDNIDTIRFILSPCIALSTIPISAAGLAIALAQNSKSAFILRVGFVSVAAIYVMLSIFFIWHPLSIYVLKAFGKGITGPPRDVIADCTTAIRIDPAMARAYAVRGYAYYKLGRKEHAISDYSRAIYLAPQEAEFYFLRASAYNEIAAYQQAVSDCSKAILIRPRFTFFLQRAIALVGLHQYETALADCNSAIALRSDAACGYVARADVYLKFGHFDKAIADLTNAIALNPTNPQEYAERSDAYARTGQSSLAQLDRRKAADLGYTSQQAGH